MSNSVADETDYGDWLTPSASIELFAGLGWDFETSGKAIGTRVKSGVIRSMAKLVVDSTGENRREFAELKPQTWHHWHPPGEYDFWQTGDLEIHSPGVTGYGDWKLVASLFGVRFDPRGMQDLMPVQSSKSPGKLASAPDPSAEITNDYIQTRNTGGTAIPSDDAIKDKMLELCAMGITRDVAAKLIHQIAGFGGVGNEHARRAVAGELPLGRKPRPK